MAVEVINDNTCSFKVDRFNTHANRPIRMRFGGTAPRAWVFYERLCCGLRFYAKLHWTATTSLIIVWRNFQDLCQRVQWKRVSRRHTWTLHFALVTSIFTILMTHKLMVRQSSIEAHFPNQIWHLSTENDTSKWSRSGLMQSPFHRAQLSQEETSH